MYKLFHIFFLERAEKFHKYLTKAGGTQYFQKTLAGLWNKTLATINHFLPLLNSSAQPTSFCHLLARLRLFALYSVPHMTRGMFSKKKKKKCGPHLFWSDTPPSYLLISEGGSVKIMPGSFFCLELLMTPAMTLMAAPLNLRRCWSSRASCFWNQLIATLALVTPTYRGRPSSYASVRQGWRRPLLWSVYRQIGVK